MRLTVSKVISSPYVVEVPDRCECGADLTASGALLHYEYQEQSRHATMHGGTALDWDDELPSGGDDYIPLEWQCAKCRRVLAAGEQHLGDEKVAVAVGDPPVADPKVRIEEVLTLARAILDPESETPDSEEAEHLATLVQRMFESDSAPQARLEAGVAALMKTYHITNTLSGHDMGPYVAESVEAALDALARDAGYADYPELQAAVPTEPGEIIVTESDQDQ